MTNILRSSFRSLVTRLRRTPAARRHATAIASIMLMCLAMLAPVPAAPAPAATSGAASDTAEQQTGQAAHAAPAANDAAARARVAFTHRLSKLDGTKLQATLVEVTYGPGESSAPHTHPCPIIGHILEGAVRMTLGDEAEKTYKAGDSFYEEANSRHLVSANASRTERVRFLAFFTCDADVPLTMPLHPAGR